MSEYQYHEWQTIDRVLTPAEQAAVNQLIQPYRGQPRQSGCHL